MGGRSSCESRYAGGHASLSADADGNVVVATGKQLLVARGTTSLPSVADSLDKTTGTNFLANRVDSIMGGALKDSRATTQLSIYDTVNFQTNADCNFFDHVRMSKSHILVPSADQTLTSGAAILANAAHVKITSAGGVTLTATPTIADGIDGQELLVENVGASAIALQDESALAGSNLENASSVTRTLSTKDIILYKYSSDASAWLEISQSNN